MSTVTKPVPRASPSSSALRQAATLAHGLGLEVAAGHGLTRSNVLDIAAIPEVVELNIGHSVIGDCGVGRARSRGA